MAYRILLVDDQREVTRLLRSALETIEQGLEVRESPSGEEAMLEASLGKFDLLVSDMRLPGMSGVELMKKMRTRLPEVKVILVTGMTDRKTQVEMEHSGADAHFHKPVPMTEFLASVEELLGMTRTVIATPPEPQIIEERKGLADLLIDLRQKLSAQAVILLDQNARAKAQAGELPNPALAEPLFASFISIFNASQKVAAMSGYAPETGFHVFRTPGVDMLLAPLDNLAALLFVGEGIASDAKLSPSLSALAEAQPELLDVLKKMVGTGTLTLPEPEPEPLPVPQIPAEPVEIPEDFAAMLGELGAKPAASKVDDFWEQAAEKGPGLELKGTITFEEAQRLGLGTDADKK
jgi:DNA-binding response OmpR family regulator